jgi:ADP-heptose:LPS heptosyltransferase
MSKFVKAIGFLGGQYGDAIICQVACRQFKKLHPNSNLTFAVSKKYEAILPFLFNNPSIDSYHVWDGYDNGWPSGQDSLFANQYDGVYHPMATHREDDWYLRRHQTEEVCDMFNLGQPESTQIILNRYFSTLKGDKYVAICPFATTRGSEKSLSINKVLEIESSLEKLGLTAVQVMGENDPQVCRKYIKTYFFQAIKEISGFKMAICVDTATSWILSGYSHPVVGLYTPSYYHGAKSSKNWQPTNKNAIYLEHETQVNDINTDKIIESVKLILN